MGYRKKDRIEEIIAQVKATVMPTEIIPVTQKIGKTWSGPCPFHGGKSKGNFMVSNDLRIYKCFNCGQAGDVIRYYALEHNYDYCTGGLELALRENIISNDEYNELTKRKMNKNDIIKLERKNMDEVIKKTKTLRNEKADNRILNRVYRLFIDTIKNSYDGNMLSEDHLNYLKGRGLSEEDIKETEYFTFPTCRKYTKVKNDFFEAVKNHEKLGKLDILTKIPGFYYDEKRGEYDFTRAECIGIPIKNERREIIAIQQRYDKVEEGSSRYRWFSSSFAETGSSPGAPIETIIPKKIKNSTIMITEGHFKAKKLAKQFNSISLSVAGVQSWRPVIKVIANLRNKYKITNIFIVFDADMCTNLGVLRPALELGNILFHQLSSNTIIVEDDYYKLNSTEVSEDNNLINFLLWDEDLGKGIDDFLENGYTPQNLDKVSLYNMVHYSSNYVSILLNKHQKELSDIYKTEFNPEGHPITVNQIKLWLTDYYKVFRDIPDEEKREVFEDVILNNLPHFKNLDKKGA